jgi:hypothetical protein
MNSNKLLLLFCALTLIIFSNSLDGEACPKKHFKVVRFLGRTVKKTFNFVHSGVSLCVGEVKEIVSRD